MFHERTMSENGPMERVRNRLYKVCGVIFDKYLEQYKIYQEWLQEKDSVPKQK